MKRSPCPPERRCGDDMGADARRGQPGRGDHRVDYAGSQPLANSQFGMTVQYSGSEEDRFSIPRPTWVPRRGPGR